MSLAQNANSCILSWRKCRRRMCKTSIACHKTISHPWTNHSWRVPPPIRCSHWLSIQRMAARSRCGLTLHWLRRMTALIWMRLGRSRSSQVSCLMSSTRHLHPFPIRCHTSQNYWSRWGPLRGNNWTKRMQLRWTLIVRRARSLNRPMWLGLTFTRKCLSMRRSARISPMPDGRRRKARFCCCLITSQKTLEMLRLIWPWMGVSIWGLQVNHLPRSPRRMWSKSSRTRSSITKLWFRNLSQATDSRLLAMWPTRWWRSRIDWLILGITSNSSGLQTWMCSDLEQQFR